MVLSTHGLVPIITSAAGLCLTPENWQEVKVEVASYYLDSLLLKPGQAVLKQLSDLKLYLGWPGVLVINAMNLIANKSGIITVISPYDGSKVHCTYPELIGIIKGLKPDAVVLPKNIEQEYPETWRDWPSSTLPLVHVDDLLKQSLKVPHGVHFPLNKDGSTGRFLAKLEECTHSTRYITGDITLDLMKLLQGRGTEYIESDRPAKDAAQGLVYSRAGVVNLLDSINKMQHETIDSECTCPTCAQQFTKAYLHHLLLHTPLLCQRFLIQHNVHWLYDYSALE